MKYHQKEWNLYIARFLMQKRTKDDSGKIITESYYLDLQLFQFDTPEEAYNEITAMIQSGSLSSAYREEDGTINTLSCIGLNDLELLQANINIIKETLETKTYGVELGSINLDEVKKDEAGLIPKKENLTLFSK